MSDKRKSRRIASGRENENGFFTERPLGLCAIGVVLGYVFALALQLIRHTWHIYPDGRSDCIDFSWIWLSSNLAMSSDPARLFEPSAFSAAMTSLAGPDCGSHFYGFGYPPTFLFFIFPLGWMPYSVALVAWMLATLLIYLAAIYVILPRPAAVVAAMTPFPVLWNVLLGHNGFLTAGLMGLSLVLTERRPWVGGSLLGLLTYKPQFGILFPLALLVARKSRVLLAAAFCSVLFGITAAIAFGHQAWPSIFHLLRGRAGELTSTPEVLVPFVSIFCSLYSIGISGRIAWAVHLAVAGGVAAMVCVLWAKPAPYALKAAALSIGSVVVTPYVLGYDACILTVGVAFLVKDGLARGFLPRERGTMLGCWAGLFLLTGPIPAIISVVLLGLVVRRAMRCQGDALAAPHPVLESRDRQHV